MAPVHHIDTSWPPLLVSRPVKLMIYEAKGHGTPCAFIYARDSETSHDHTDEVTSP
jgi:hypothetical protein